MFQTSVIRGDIERIVPADSWLEEVDRSHSRVVARAEGSLNILADCTELSLSISKLNDLYHTTRTHGYCG